MTRYRSRTAWMVAQLVALGAVPGAAQSPAPGGAAVSIQVDLTRDRGPMDPIWSWFGYDEPNYTYMKHGRKLLSELAALSPVPVHVRVHNLLTSGDGTPALKWGSTNAYTEDAAGNPVYDWTIVDSIFDTYVARGMKPLVEIGFMPEALSRKPQPYRHNWRPDRPYNEIFTGWSHPPRDYDRWAELVYQWVLHSVERYGRQEVESWHWGVWNEPDIGYWQGTPEEFFKLYDYSVDAVRRALPTARVGGPHTTPPGYPSGSNFLKAFLEHCRSGTNYRTGKKGSPLDFITFHAKGGPRIVDGYVQMDVGRQLRDIAAGFEIVASFPEFRRVPIIIGESDPEGCAACSEKDNPHNAYRNGTMFSSYTAASFARKYELAEHYGVNLLGAVTWAFEFEDQPYFAGFRSLATNGVDKPVLNVFRMFGMMRGNRVDVIGGTGYDAMRVRDASVRGQPDINALAAREDRTATVLVWNYHDDNVPAPAAPVAVSVKGLPQGRVLLQHFRIDAEHSNAYEAWKRMGSPQNPTPEQYSALERAGQLHLLGSPTWVASAEGETVVEMQLPRQGVSLLRFSW